MQRTRLSCWAALQIFGFISLVAYLAFTYNNYIRKQRADVGFAVLYHFNLNHSHQHASTAEESAASGPSHVLRNTSTSGTSAKQDIMVTHSTRRHTASPSSVQEPDMGRFPSGFHNKTPESVADFFTIIPNSVESTDYPDLTRFDVPRLSHPNLPRLLNGSEYQQLHALMAGLDKIFTENNITYILAYGSLLGSYLLHDILPWDDDLDLLVRFSDRQKMLDLFKQSRYDHIGAIEHKGHAAKMIKLFYKNSPQAGKYAWKWPFADAAFYDENQDNVWSTQKGVIKMKRSKFYPLHRRPYGGLWLPAPRDPRTFLRFKYHTFVCKSHYWNHRREISAQPISASCSTLLDYYPMVHRTPEGEGVRETLKLGKRVLYSVHIDEVYWNQAKPYLLK